MFNFFKNFSIKKNKKLDQSMITEHFNIHEFDCNDGTPYPVKWVETRLKPLCVDLEVIRDFFGGVPVKINSGFRTKSYNQKVGGAEKSQHLEGKAADIVVSGIDAREAYSYILKLINDGDLKKIRAVGSYSTFVHVDIRESKKIISWVF